MRRARVYSMRKRRRLVWLFACFGGRLCVDVDVMGVELPAGTLAVVKWECDKCGTRYQRDVLAGDDESYTVTERERTN